MAGVKRLSLEEIVERKDRSIDCRICWTPMRYKRVRGRMEDWSPSPYAWFCPRMDCKIIQLDGSLDPNERTLHVRIQEEEKQRISSYLSSVFRAQKNEPEN